MKFGDEVQIIQGSGAGKTGMVHARLDPQNPNGLFTILCHDGTLETKYPSMAKIVSSRVKFGTVVVLRNPGPGFPWTKEMEKYVGREVSVEGLLQFEKGEDRWLRMYQVSGNMYAWVEQSLGTPCAHEFVNVGFMSVKMACKHCGSYI